MIVGVATYFLLNNKKKNKGQNASTDFKEAESEKVSDNDELTGPCRGVRDDDTELDKMLGED